MLTIPYYAVPDPAQSEAPLKRGLPPNLGHRYDVRSLLKAVLPSPTIVRYVRKMERPGLRSIFVTFGYTRS